MHCKEFGANISKQTYTTITPQKISENFESWILTSSKTQH